MQTLTIATLVIAAMLAAVAAADSVTFDNLKISVRAARIAALCTSSIGTPS